MEEIALMVLPREASNSDESFNEESDYERKVDDDRMKTINGDTRVLRIARFFKCSQCPSHPRMDMDVHLACTRCTRPADASSHFFDEEGFVLTGYRIPRRKEKRGYDGSPSAESDSGWTNDTGVDSELSSRDFKFDFKGAHQGTTQTRRRCTHQLLGGPESSGAGRKDW